MIKLQKVSQSDNLIQKNLKANSLKTLHKFLKQVRLKKFLAVKKPLLKAEKAKKTIKIIKAIKAIKAIKTIMKKGLNLKKNHKPSQFFDSRMRLN